MGAELKCLEIGTITGIVLIIMPGEFLCNSRYGSIRTKSRIRIHKTNYRDLHSATSDSDPDPHG